MIAVEAPAKLTWFLEVTGRREDGYHEIRSEMATLRFGDRLLIDEEADYLRMEPAAGVSLDQSNLVRRALDLVGRTAGVTVEKVIPVGGGLGGGSADAAAILRWSGGVSAVQALTLGGDVPFCQIGGRAMVEGVGELLTPLEFLARNVTLLIPAFSVDTGACYRVFDELVAAGVKLNGRNHLEHAAGLVEPRLANTLGWLRSEFGEGVQLAGSGSTMFIEGHVAFSSADEYVEGPEGTVRLLQTTTSPR